MHIVRKLLQIGSSMRSRQSVAAVFLRRWIFPSLATGDLRRNEKPRLAGGVKCGSAVEGEKRPAFWRPSRLSPSAGCLTMSWVTRQPPIAHCLRQSTGGHCLSIVRNCWPAPARLPDARAIAPGPGVTRLASRRWMWPSPTLWRQPQVKGRYRTFPASARRARQR